MQAGGAARYEASLAEHKAETLEWLRQGKLQTPTLLYWARNDPSAILAIEMALFELLAETNRLTRFLIVNQAGHFHFREYPEEMNRNVINFIQTGGVSAG